MYHIEKIEIEPGFSGVDHLAAELAGYIMHELNGRRYASRASASRGAQRARRRVVARLRENNPSLWGRVLPRLEFAIGVIE
jgi:hypothetical protein